MAKAAAKKPPTKTEIYANIAESTGLTKKDVGAVFEALNDEIACRGDRTVWLADGQVDHIQLQNQNKEAAS